MKRILGLLGWVGVVLVVTALALRITRPDLNIHPKLALAGLVVTALYTLSQWRDIVRSFKVRGVKYGSVSAGSVLLVLAILAGINWISARQNKRWDLTASKQYSLSDQTKQILRTLQKPVVIRLFYKSDPTFDLQRYRDQLGEYAYHSNQVKIEYIDADKEPFKAKQYEVQAYGTVVFEYDARIERTTSTDEQGLTNALKKVLEGKAKKIYFVQGHGEHDPSASEPEGYSGIESSLKSENFEIAKVTLAQEGKVPDDATVLVVAGPKTDFFPPELDAVRAFLKRSGKLWLMIDPPDKAATAEPTQLIALAKEWGFIVGNDIVVDASGMGKQLMGTDASVPLGIPVQHPITEGFRLLTGFPFARSVTPVEGGTDGKFPQKVIETDPRSWAETDIKGLFTTGKPNRDLDKGDKTGPITIVAAVSAPAAEAPAPATPDAPKPETRVVVVGDSDFVSNRAINIPGNRDLGLNIANWLAQQENLIAIRPRDPDSRPITLTEAQSTRISWLTLAIVPGLLFATALRVWWKRR
ncbi:MAG TPA: Gldg family protein [Vicinamibacterales bacterium]|nr:Gldg family protein [Vicinamibacterales bacterium]